MKISVLQENLNKGINIAGRFISPRSQLPVLQNILISAKEGKTRISATNLEIGISVYINAKIESEGEITVPAKILSEFVNNLPAEKTELFLDKNSLKIICGGYRAVINGAPAGDFPLASQLQNKPQMVWQKKVFSLASQQVVFSASLDENRPVLNGVLVSLKKNQIRMVATDGYRLSLKELETENGAGKEEARFLIPSRALLEAGKITQEKEEGKNDSVGISLLEEGKQAVFFWDDIELTTRLIDGAFPDYEKIIPKEAGAETVFDRAEMLRAVKSAAVFARDAGNIIKFKISRDNIEIFANTAQVGQNNVTVGAQGAAETEIAFNSRFLLDFLNNAAAERIVLSTSTSLSPGVFKQEKDKTFLHIIMPVRIQD
ncbi:MAG: DNA polymerase III subunit beta [Patescibacteria group bacterium]|nr:DNA polymerase III subunit beta [Patescibacteria group bacterium]